MLSSVNGEGLLKKSCIPLTHVSEDGILAFPQRVRLLKMDAVLGTTFTPGFPFQQTQSTKKI